jgi:large subunit ribosomal protein L9
MNIILKDDIGGLGFKNDLVKVKAGYARNYLIPNGLAIVANQSNVKMRDEDVRQAVHKQESLISAATKIKEGVEKLSLKFEAKVGDTGKIYGSISTANIAAALKEKGYAIDKKRISIHSQVKELGEYAADIALHREVTASVPFEVVAEEQKKD